jgi:hypothetical protein
LENKSYMGLSPEAPVIDFTDYLVEPDDLNRLSRDEEVFSIMKNFWTSNKRTTGANIRSDIMVVPNLNSVPYSIYGSEYNGLDEAGVSERQERLEQYNHAWLRLLHDEPHLTRFELERRKLGLYAGMVGLAGSNGIQGVETFTFKKANNLETTKQLASAPMSVPAADFAVWRTYALPEEQTKYDTPRYHGGFPLPALWEERTLTKGDLDETFFLT